MIADLPPVVINEIAWMGTQNSANDEWIELRNNTNLPINFEGWTLKKIKLAGTIPAQGFYLLERTDDSTVPGIPADQIYTGALNNKGEKLELYDNLGSLIDSADGSLGWPAGDNATKQTMERKDAESWQTSQNPGGTPKAENSKPAENSSPPSQPAKKSDEVSPLELAAVSEPIQPANISEFVAGKTDKQAPIFIALATAVFSGIMILSLKRKLNHQKET